MSDEKQTFLEKLSAQLLELDGQFGELKRKAAQSSGDAKRKIEEQITDFNKKMIEVENKVEQIQSVSEDAWLTAKAGMENAFEELALSFHAIKESFKKL